jgi:Asp-tRNA(Asn)/Glu-tRNA(Gln) amidotransferase A subunit family amidase
MCLGAIGSQTAGSIIRPAAFCGVCGLKPTFGRVDRSGVLVSSPSLDQVGALAGSAADLKLLWQAIADPPPVAAPTAAGHEAHPHEHHHWHLPHHHRAADDPGFPARPPRLGIVRSLLADTSPEVLWVIEATLGWLESHAVELTLADLPVEVAEIQAMHRVLMTVEMAQYHRHDFAARRTEFGPSIAKLIEEGLATDASRYEAARRHQATLRTQLAAAMAGVDAWMLPATITTAGSPETTGDPRPCVPWSYAGLPAITLPCGVAKDDLPVGLQLVGPGGADDQLLELAIWCEERLAFGDLPKLLAELG